MQVYELIGLVQDKNLNKIKINGVQLTSLTPNQIGNILKKEMQGITHINIEVSND